MVIPDKNHGLYGFHHIYVNKTGLQTLKIWRRMLSIFNVYRMRRFIGIFKGDHEEAEEGIDD